MTKEERIEPPCMLTISHARLRFLDRFQRVHELRHVQVWIRDGRVEQLLQLEGNVWSGWWQLMRLTLIAQRSGPLGRCQPVYHVGRRGRRSVFRFLRFSTCKNFSRPCFSCDECQATQLAHGMAVVLSDFFWSFSRFFVETTRRTCAYIYRTVI